MANTINYTELDAVTNRLYLPALVSQLWLTDPILNKLKDTKKSSSGGTKITVGIKTDILNGGAYKPYNNGANKFNIAERSTLTAVDYEIRGLYANLTMDNYIDSLNSGNNAMHNILEERMTGLQETMQDQLLQSLYKIDDGSHFVGLVDAIDNNNIYAGLDRTIAANAFWKSYVVEDTGSGAITLDMPKLQSFFMNVTRGGADAQKLVFVCDYGTFGKIHSLLMAQNHIVTRSETEANLGFSNIELFGKPVFASSYLESVAKTTGQGVLYAVNFSYFELRTLSGRDFYFTKFKEAQDTDAVVKQLLLQGNFVSTKPSALGRISNINLA
jgi:hypothetical protein